MVARWNQHEARLAGIDAPEKAQPFGAKSKANLSRMACSRDLTLDCRKFDRYRREIWAVSGSSMGRA